MGASDWIAITAVLISGASLFHSVRTSRRQRKLEDLHEHLARLQIEEQEETARARAEAGARDELEAKWRYLHREGGPIHLEMNDE